MKSLCEASVFTKDGIPSGGGVSRRSPLVGGDIGVALVWRNRHHVTKWRVLSKTAAVDLCALRSQA